MDKSVSLVGKNRQRDIFFVSNTNSLTILTTKGGKEYQFWVISTLTKSAGKCYHSLSSGEKPELLYRFSSIFSIKKNAAF